MSDKAWEQLVDMIDQKFEIDSHKKSHEPLEGSKLERHHDEIFFEKGGTSYKIDRVTQPAVLDTKTHYAQRGAAQRVEKRYDAEETVSRVYFYEQAHDGYWNEISPEDLLAAN